MEFVEAMKKADRICRAYNCCDDCPLRNTSIGYCAIKFNLCCDFEKIEKIISEWQPPVDWSKVKVDTPILVWDDGEELKHQRHFAKYENGKVYAWCYGKTSYTANNADSLTDWQHAELAEVGEENG